MCAILTSPWPELTRPTYSSISLGLLPAASIRVGLEITTGIQLSFVVTRYWMVDPDAAKSRRRSPQRKVKAVGFEPTMYGLIERGGLSRIGSRRTVLFSELTGVDQLSRWIRVHFCEFTDATSTAFRG